MHVTVTATIYRSSSDERKFTTQQKTSSNINDSFRGMLAVDSIVCQRASISLRSIAANKSAPIVSVCPSSLHDVGIIKLFRFAR